MGSVEPSPSPSPGSMSSALSSVATNGVPKVGTLVPNRVFVGGISSSTTESELHQLFSEFGNVKQTKIIADRAGVSKGYGFVTFETEEEARRLQAASEDIVLKERKLNIAPAIKKQLPYGRSYEMGQPVVNGALYYHNGIPYTYQQNGVAMFVPDGVGGLLSPPSGKSGSATTSPYSLMYPGGPGGAAAAMFLPSAAAAAVASQQQQQLQFQNALRDVAAAQSQNPGSGSSTPGTTPTAAAAAAASAWRWINSPPGSAAAGSCQQQQQQAAAAGSQSSQQQQQAAAMAAVNQALSYAQAHSGFLPMEAFHYFPTGFPGPGMGLSSLPHPGFVLPDRTF